MESEGGVLLPLFHEHPMMPWNDHHMRKGDCCDYFEPQSDGYYCKLCDFFVHKKCGDELSEFISDHPSHPDHTLRLQEIREGNVCDICEWKIKNLCYRCCDGCDFDLDLHCVKYPPPDVIDNFETHPHKLTFVKDKTIFDCSAKCGTTSGYYFGYTVKFSFGVSYKCEECDVSFHVECVWHPAALDHQREVNHPYHSLHPLKLFKGPPPDYSDGKCRLCGRKVDKELFYHCSSCNFTLDWRCVVNPPPQSLLNLKAHDHQLKLLPRLLSFTCNACGLKGDRSPYMCVQCDFMIHQGCLVECVWLPAALDHQPEVNHPYHSLHPLKVLTGPPPHYSDGKCRLCGRKIGEYFYHCSSCNFTVDFHCVLIPPQKSLVDPKVHDHQLTLLPRLDSFTCNACGLKGDRSPYACFDCGFMIHQDCLGLPRVININRHDHRVSRTSVLGDAAMNSVCGVCRKKVDWTCGGFSCKRCPGYVVHSKCATRKDVWNGEELEGVPEEEEDIEPYVVIDDNTIQHFSHKEHYLIFNENGVLYEDTKRCSACTHPISLQSFYSCVDCDFSLHQNCAKCPKKKRHVLHYERLTLVTNKELQVFSCDACYRRSNGFMYKDEDKEFDVLCGSISEPFFHPSYPHHPLYYIPTEKDDKICNGCNSKEYYVLRCIEDDCRFVICFKCATLPQVVKNRVDDHPLSLCYGEEEEASGKYWCDICEKETDSKEWFYTCKDQRASLHTKCVLGDSTGLMPRSVAKLFGDSYKVGLNNSITRPFCSECKSRCMYPINLKSLGAPEICFCSVKCSPIYLRSIKR